MSTYENQNGVIRLSTAQFKELLSSVKPKYNMEIERDFQYYLSVYSHLKPRVSPSVSPSQDLPQMIKLYLMENEADSKIKTHDWFYHYQSVLVRTFEKNGKMCQTIRRPRKSDSIFALIPKSKKTIEFYLDGLGELTLDEKSQTIRWQVFSDFNCIDQARSKVIAKLVFQWLRSVRNWPKDTGGAIYTFTEYDEMDGNGRAQIFEAYGPRGAEAKKSSH